MSGATSIEWTDVTWNPVRGCSRVSEGCRNCYAERMAARFSKPGEAFDGFAGTDGGPHWTGRVELIPDKLDEPLHWKKPRRVFVNSMSDLFHEKLTDWDIDKVFAVMAQSPEHSFQILTKRPGRLLSYLGTELRDERVDESGIQTFGWCHSNVDGRWPLPNVWLGVSVEDQATADERIPVLLETPAAVRFVSYEPAISAVDFSRHLPCLNCGGGGSVERSKDGVWRGSGWLCEDCDGNSSRGLSWLIVGGESGQNARPFDLAWARNSVAQCKAAGVPVFVKQLGRRVLGDSDGAHVDRWIFPDGSEWQPPTIGWDGKRPKDAVGFKLFDAKGGDMDQWPADLRVREFPQSRREAV